MEEVYSGVLPHNTDGFRTCCESGPGPSHEIWDARRLVTSEDRAALDALEGGYRDLTLVWLDARHAIAILKPGGATRLAS